MKLEIEALIAAALRSNHSGRVEENESYAFPQMEAEKVDGDLGPAYRSNISERA